MIKLIPVRKEDPLRLAGAEAGTSTIQKPERAQRYSVSSHQ